MEGHRVKKIYDFMEGYDFTEFRMTRKRLRIHYILMFPEEINLSSIQFNKYIHFYCKNKGVRCGEMKYKGKFTYFFTTNF